MELFKLRTKCLFARLESSCRADPQFPGSKHFVMATSTCPRCRHFKIPGGVNKGTVILEFYRTVVKIIRWTFQKYRNRMNLNSYHLQTQPVKPCWYFSVPQMRDPENVHWCKRSPVMLSPMYLTHMLDGLWFHQLSSRVVFLEEIL